MSLRSIPGLPCPPAGQRQYAYLWDEQQLLQTLRPRNTDTICNSLYVLLLYKISCCFVAFCPFGLCHFSECKVKFRGRKQTRPSFVFRPKARSTSVRRSSRIGAAKSLIAFFSTRKTSPAFGIHNFPSHSIAQQKLP
jgi:hypothetical protein